MCRAGVGRTGTFILVDWLLQHIQYHQTVSIYEIVLKLRESRNLMVQTEVSFGNQVSYFVSCEMNNKPW
jgi:protein tyrosine phosphatase